MLLPQKRLIQSRNSRINTPEEITGYRSLLYELAEQYTNIPLKDLPIEDHPLWLEITKLPDAVQQKLEEIGVNITLKQWKKTYRVFFKILSYLLNHIG
ncbi:nitrate reductase associated protein [Planktothrix agardhii 1033]|nr:nitrate reductase associated protein [Planktothrix agardhii 1033]